MPEELAPPVVAIVVTSNPGEWFEPCLESVARQDYPNQAVLVVCDEGDDEVTQRIAAIEPEAIVRRRPPGGYAAGANEALSGVAGASFYLFCHDDVVLEPSATRRLVEEAFRSNAGVVGPKVVEVGDPERLLQVGLNMHRLGTPAPRVHPGELDQAQHDGARDVFAVPGGCILVRADLFEALGGFDAEMDLFGEDIDFCWRAQAAGARVTVASQARVAHHQLTSSGCRGERDPRLLQRRHELRSALKNYSGLRQPLVVLELLALGLAEMVVATLNGERERARRVVRAWRWNLARRSSLRSDRRHLRQLRQVPDRELVRRMLAPSRLRRFVRPEETGFGPTRFRHAVSGIEHALEVDRLESWWTRVQQGEVPAAQLSLAAALVVLGLAGTRDLLFSKMPMLGDFVRLAPGTNLLGRYLSGVVSGGVVRPAPPGFAVLGLFGLVLGNSTSLGLKVLELGSLVLGAVGVSRLCRPFLSSRGRLAAAAAFVALPLAWNDIATGGVQAAVALGAAPFILARLARATRLAPFVAEPAGQPASLLGEVAPFGLLLAVSVALAPPLLLATGAVVVAGCAACLLAAKPRAAYRLFVVAAGASGTAFLICLPWSLSWFEEGARFSAFGGAVAAKSFSPAAILVGHIGPVGGWWAAFGVAVAASYALLAGRGERLTWASSWWLSAIAVIALCWAGSRGWLGAGGGATAVMGALAAAGLAACCGLGVVAFERDVITARGLGLRQIGAGLALAALVIGALPGLSSLVGGRGELPGTGIEQTLDWTATATGSQYRVLWAGDPLALPGHGWQMERGLAWYASTRGLPGANEEWPSASPGTTGKVASDLTAALKGSTTDLGALIAPLGIRYIVVPTANAPRILGTQQPSVSAPPPAGLLSVLEDQNDLVERPVEAGAYVFLNADWKPSDAIGPPVALPPKGFYLTTLWRDVGLGIGLLVALLAIGEGVRRRRSWGTEQAPRSPDEPAEEEPPAPEPEPDAVLAASHAGGEPR
jgi:GT2 family glycosyltransferase